MLTKGEPGSFDLDPAYVSASRFRFFDQNGDLLSDEDLGIYPSASVGGEIESVPNDAAA